MRRRPITPVEQDISARTDLAVERVRAGSKDTGISVTKSEFAYGTISRVVVENETGARTLGKPPVTYVTVECPGVH